MTQLTSHFINRFISFIVIFISLTLFTKVGIAQNQDEKDLNKAEVIPFNTITWYDLNWSKDVIPSSDSVAISGKLHLFKNWSQRIGKPSNAIVRINVQGDNGSEPVFLQEMSIGKPFVAHQPVDLEVYHPVNLDLGKSYEFSAIMSARRPGNWLVSPEIIIDEKEAISGPAKPLTVTGLNSTLTYPTPPKISDVLKEAPIKEIQSIDLKSNITASIDEASYLAKDFALHMKMTVTNKSNSSVRLGEFNTAGGMRFLDPAVQQDDTGYPNNFLFEEGLSVSNITLENPIKPGETRKIEVQAISKAWETFFHLSNSMDDLNHHLGALLFFSNEMGVREIVEVDVPL